MLGSIEGGVGGEEEAFDARVDGAAGGEEVDACGIRAVEARGGVDDVEKQEHAGMGEGGEKDGRRQE